MLTALLQLLATVLAVPSRGLEGHFGTHNALQMARQGGLPLIATRRDDTARSCPSTGPYAGHGPRRTYGHKVDDDHLPGHWLKETTVAGHIETRLDQMPELHKECAQPLHVVIITTTNVRTQARAQVGLCSSDLALAYAPRVDYDGLRFHIALHCRDAQQDWGLEDFLHGPPRSHACGASVLVYGHYSLPSPG